VAQAGGALLTESVRASSLDLALSAALKPWRSSSATHNPAKVLTAIDRARTTARTAVRKAAGVHALTHSCGPATSTADGSLRSSPPPVADNWLTSSCATATGPATTVPTTPSSNPDQWNQRPPRTTAGRHATPADHNHPRTRPPTRVPALRPDQVEDRGWTGGGVALADHFLAPCPPSCPASAAPVTGTGRPRIQISPKQSRDGHGLHRSGRSSVLGTLKAGRPSEDMQVSRQ